MQRGMVWLLATAVAAAWGISYVCTTIGLRAMAPVWLIAVRFGLACLVIGICGRRRLKSMTKKVALFGIIGGLCLFAAYICMGYGLREGTVSRAGFLCSVQILFVILFRCIRLRKPPKKRDVAALCLLVIGILAVCYDGHIVFDFSAVLCIGCSFFFGLQITLTDHVAGDADPVAYTSVQLGCAALTSGISLVFLPIRPLCFSLTDLYMLLILSLVCTAFPILALAWLPRHLSTQKISYVLTLEPIFSCLWAYLFLGETVTPMCAAGGIVIVAGILIGVG